MSPHELADEFVSHYLSIMHGDNDTSNFQRVLEMKVSPSYHIITLSIPFSHRD